MDKERIDENPENWNASTDPERETPVNIQPWRDIFFRPRLTARWLIQHETPASATMMWLAFTALFIVGQFLELMFGTDNPDPSAKIRLVMYIPLFFMVSIGFYLLESYILYRALRLVGGQDDSRAVRIVFSFTNVIPGAVFMVPSLALFFLLPRDSYVGQIIANIIMIWSLYITLAGLAESARLPLWRAMAAYLTTALMWAVAVVMIAAALGLGLPAGLPDFAG